MTRCIQIGFTVYSKHFKIAGPFKMYMQQSASPPSLIAYRCRPTAGTVHLKSSQKPGPISESGGSDGSRLSVFICCIPSCAYSLFFPPRHKNINFQPGVAANFLHLTAHSVHHRDCFRQGSGSVSQRKELLIQFFFFGSQSPNGLI